MKISPLLLCSLLLLLVNGKFTLNPALGSGTGLKATGDYRDSPVFFEMFYNEYADTSNLTLLPRKKLHISPFGVKDVDDFSWYDAQTIDYSWWVQVETLKFLLPLIKSSDLAHRRIARSWLEGWSHAHNDGPAPNRAAWHLMTVAERSMVLVYYLKDESARSSKNPEIIDLLSREIKRHQQYLSAKERFSFNSNHGLMEAIGLLETTRVFVDDLAVILGRNRLESIAVGSVSKKGIELEHSCGYHFCFMKWLLEYILYANSQKQIQKYDTQRIEAVGEMMIQAAYYMQDHDGNIPPIGDTDPKNVRDVLSYDGLGIPEEVCFDGEAGFAVFKDNPGARIRRYVVFNIQNVNPSMPYHYHNDALAVYFNCDGETLLGDQGRYQYGESGRRIYFVSHLAHNTVFPLKRLSLSKTGGGRFLTDSPWWNREGDKLYMGARLSYPRNSIKRCVTIPRDGWPFIVSDTLAGRASMVLLWNIGSDVTHIEACEAGESDIARHEWILHTKKNRNYSLSIDVVEGITRAKHSAELLTGSTKPFLGWYAPYYKKCVPSPVIKIELHPAGEIYVTTRIQTVESSQ
jgi:hypothetical protein